MNCLLTQLFDSTLPTELCRSIIMLALEDYYRPDVFPEDNDRVNRDRQQMLVRVSQIDRQWRVGYSLLSSLQRDPATVADKTRSM